MNKNGSDMLGNKPPPEGDGTTCVAFVMTDVSWTGGINYFRSLFDAIALAAGSRFRVVLLTQPGRQEWAKTQFGQRPVIESRWVAGAGLNRFLRTGCRRLLGRDLILERLLAGSGIALSSHGPALGRTSSVPSLVWIPDFQHLHLPHFFSPKMVLQRTAGYRRLAANATRVIVSSTDAQTDLARLLGAGGAAGDILRFVPSIPERPRSTRAELEARYGFAGKYLFLPNQFWAHKNHLVVIEAVRNLMQLSDPPQILCSGELSDFRNPNHIGLIRAEIRKSEIRAHFRLLGAIPYQDVFDLMFYSHAVINPSLFEGWSTTVEEAKLLNKRLILSDINVHREQAQSRAQYFKPDSAIECLEAIRCVWAADSLEPDPLYHINAKAGLLDFGRRYLEIVRECVTKA
jgi:glycosyltransferase involved in cell wall biosynthesis